MSSKQAAAACKKRPAASNGDGKGGVKVAKGSRGELQPSAVAEWLLSANANAFEGCFGKAANDKYKQLKDKLQRFVSSVDSAIVGMADGDLRDCVRAESPFTADERQDLRENMCGRSVAGTLLIGPNKVSLSAYSSVDAYECEGNVVTDCEIFSFEEDNLDDSFVAHDDIKFHWDVAAKILRTSGIQSFSCKDLGIEKPLVVPAVIDAKSPPSVLKAFVWGLMHIIEDEMNEAEDSCGVGTGWSADTESFMDEDAVFRAEMFPDDQ